MRKILSGIIVITGIIFAQTIMWEKHFPFETVDDGPVGIDITQDGNILIVCYSSGPNYAYWDSESGSVKGPDTKILILEEFGNEISSQSYNLLFNGGIKGIGSTDTGYSLFGNFVEDNPNYVPSSAWIIRHYDEQIDTLKNNSSGFTEGYSFQKTKTSFYHSPVTFMTSYYTGKSGSNETVLVDCDNISLMHKGFIQFPDSLFYDPSDKWVQFFDIFDFDYNESSEMFITGSLSGMSLNAEYEFVIKFDIEKNVVWQKYYYGYDPSEGQIPHNLSMVSATNDGGCLAGVKAGNECFIIKYDSTGNESYSFGVSDELDFIHRVGINEFVYREKGSSALTKIIEGEEFLSINWTQSFPDTKTIRPIDNGFIAAGIEDSNIIVFKVATGTGIEDTALPVSTALFQNYPNPFNPVTQIKFVLAKTADIKLSVFNINGQLVSQLLSGSIQAGVHAVDFDASRFNSGIYYYTLEVDGKSLTKRMLMIK